MVGGDRVVQITQIFERIAQVVERLGIIRLEKQRVPQKGHGIVRIPLLRRIPKLARASGSPDYTVIAAGVLNSTLVIASLAVITPRRCNALACSGSRLQICRQCGRPLVVDRHDGAEWQLRMLRAPLPWRHL